MVQMYGFGRRRDGQATAPVYASSSLPTNRILSATWTFG
ncbi:hypothetical protein I550_0491 [Mycobacterium intracellulare 1956]|uniref:Uncharacterized protein n=1 Tax=Mycobacterium intracellulare 1956 TaxID=1299331 RepID=X8CNF3_MYCIT|nr:hypothetical protein I550_0491 [Mycobacterium intracellulare 1956]